MALAWTPLLNVHFGTYDLQMLTIPALCALSIASGKFAISAVVLLWSMPWLATAFPMLWRGPLLAGPVLVLAIVLTAQHKKQGIQP